METGATAKSPHAHDGETDRLHAPFLVNRPYSIKADKTGLSDGKLITTYAQDALKLIQAKDQLQAEINLLTKQAPGTQVEIMHFENWGKTKEALLLHVKPTRADQVVAIVKGVISLNEKGIVSVSASFAIIIACVLAASGKYCSCK